MVVDAETPQRVLRDVPDVLRSTVEPEERRPAPGFDAEAELGGDDHLLPDRTEGLADELLVDVRTVDLGGVEEGDAAVDGRAHERDEVVPCG